MPHHRWDDFRVNLVTRLVISAMRLAPRDYRKWLREAIMVGAQVNAGKPKYEVTMSSFENPGDTTDFTFNTIGELEAFQLGMRFAASQLDAEIVYASAGPNPKHSN